jgi:hypothetical protein
MTHNPTGESPDAEVRFVAVFTAVHRSLQLTRNRIERPAEMGGEGAS